ncbi:hypothetical protein G647_02187 [Cladophialophora carrionii CBS 160.54]|uniref:BIR-domain-containing protein n=1 Tax=Cladophialophora carrionii CBS 160.54 TaxID=1279043 RepID=V9DEV9_9EURO|nr:uncharacterized protein G647_02187 [Cladophialophora carrionii CBS 160.54]ETI25414.1 hypothetical protein G647_02187 [Cladophialophora carrionii CBS 160.54]
MEYATLESRLATFEPPTKRSKIGWPHKTPTPEEVARAGFYYKPSKSSNDNTICYLCESQLGGWEPDDDPVEEHLKHSPQCGWAILMNASQEAKQHTETMEDPTGQLLADARRATFAAGWPHESKRAWKCKIERMVEAGWHFAPVAEGEDYVSCAYCKLSLDGWEPKDDPFEEHYKRSPDCVFFQFAGNTAPTKRPKAKKGRASRASRSSKASTRLSTQSSSQDVTSLSEAPSVALEDIPDLEDSIDEGEMSTMSVVSVISTASTATTKAKRKGAGGRSKTAKSKKAKTTRSTKTKKEDSQPEIELEVQPELVQEIPETSKGVVVESVPLQAEEVYRTPETEEREEQVVPGPAPTPSAEVAYPTIPLKNTPPRISNSPRHLSPVAAQDQSPTPIKPRSNRSSLASAQKSTPKSATTKSHLQPKSATARSSSRTQPQSQQADNLSPSPSPSPATSDLENAPPSTRSPRSRPPIATSSISPLPPNPKLNVTSTSSSPPKTLMPHWTPADVELIFAHTTPARAECEVLLALTGSQLSSPEKDMTVQEWIEFIAARAEEGLRTEAERVVSVFEREGQRAMGVLEAIPCV